MNYISNKISLNENSFTPYGRRKVVEYVFEGIQEAYLALLEKERENDFIKVNKNSVDNKINIVNNLTVITEKENTLDYKSKSDNKIEKLKKIISNDTPNLESQSLSSLASFISNKNNGTDDKLLKQIIKSESFKIDRFDYLFSQKIEDKDDQNDKDNKLINHEENLKLDKNLQTPNKANDHEKFVIVNKGIDFEIIIDTKTPVKNKEGKINLEEKMNFAEENKFQFINYNSKPIEDNSGYEYFKNALNEDNNNSNLNLIHENSINLNLINENSKLNDILFITESKSKEELLLNKNCKKNMSDELKIDFSKNDKNTCNEIKQENQDSNSNKSNNKKSFNFDIATMKTLQTIQFDNDNNLVQDIKEIKKLHKSLLKSITAESCNETIRSYFIPYKNVILRDIDEYKRTDVTKITLTDISDIKDLLHKFVSSYRRVIKDSVLLTILNLLEEERKNEVD